MLLQPCTLMCMALSPMTGHGHNTDIAIIMGLAGYLPHDVDIDLIPTFIEQVKQTKNSRLLRAKNG